MVSIISIITFSIGFAIGFVLFDLFLKPIFEKCLEYILDIVDKVMDCIDFIKDKMKNE